METLHLKGFPTWEQFLEFDKLMKKIGFRLMIRDEIRESLSRLEGKAPRHVTGKEVGYIWISPFGYSVIIWTTAIWQEKRLRDIGEDAGWVIIVKDNKLSYCTRYFMRTGNFFLRLARYAWISKWKVEHNPSCPCESCLKMMYIYRKRGTRQYMWRCDNREAHQAPTFRSWDYELPPNAKSFLEVRRSSTRKYNQKNKEEGKSPIPKAFTRKRKKTIKA